MKAEWTTKLGNKYEMTAEVVGTTVKDMVYNKISIAMNGATLTVNGQRTEEGKNLLLVHNGGKQFLVALPDSVYAEMDAQLTTRKNEVRNANIATAAEIAQAAKELEDYLFAQSMSNPNSDY